ncbi:hypothetical protein DEAC_c24770 [Desulfosporosinus acididurans]|uniref:Uncharacterized protein n=1 Tax=Desulfosporosinus acididurans TaxID=476652 RepID=A0A0J1FRA3_9FIRM|nr:hypothetical protein [Desulfosporosinus acididurans]KLU65847.1 hypothetical protein DEAC_c24770 [Desulfosporosinus acididurans]
MMVKRLLTGGTPDEAYQYVQRTAHELFKETIMNDELIHYDRILNGILPQLQEDEISSSGYVVHTYITQSVFYGGKQRHIDNCGTVAESVCWICNTI